MKKYFIKSLFLLSFLTTAAKCMESDNGTKPRDINTFKNQQDFSRYTQNVFEEFYKKINNCWELSSEKNTQNKVARTFKEVEFFNKQYVPFKKPDVSFPVFFDELFTLKRKADCSYVREMGIFHLLQKLGLIEEIMDYMMEKAPDFPKEARGYFAGYPSITTHNYIQKKTPKELEMLIKESEYTGTCVKMLYIQYKIIAALLGSSNKGILEPGAMFGFRNVGGIKNGLLIGENLIVVDITDEINPLVIGFGPVFKQGPVQLSKVGEYLKKEAIEEFSKKHEENIYKVFDEILKCEPIYKEKKLLKIVQMLSTSKEDFNLRLEELKELKEDEKQMMLAVYSCYQKTEFTGTDPEKAKKIIIKVSKNLSTEQFRKNYKEVEHLGDLFKEEGEEFKKNFDLRGLSSGNSVYVLSLQKLQNYKEMLNEYYKFHIISN